MFSDEVIPSSDALVAGFRSTDIDPNGFVQSCVNQLKGYMDLYVLKSTEYAAPYTSLVTSFMMGKSRLMKEITSFLIYICTRLNSSSGYPKATSHVTAWFDRGTADTFNPILDPQTMATQDKGHLLSTLKYSSFLLSFIELSRRS